LAIRIKLDKPDYQHVYYQNLVDINVAHNFDIKGKDK